MSNIEKVRVATWPTPRGYENGMLGRGPALHVAGQIGWSPDGVIVSDDFVAQFQCALDNVLAVVAAAGGVPSDIASMTVYVTDIVAYRNSLRAIGALWKPRLGTHFPARALVGVSMLVEPRAQVEIQAVAYLAAE